MELTPALEQAIAALAAEGHLPGDYAAQHLALTRFLIAARLLAPDAQTPPSVARTALAKCCEADSYKALLQRLADARHGVGEQWAEHFGEQLEID